MGDSIRLQAVNAVAAALAVASVTLNEGTPNEATYTKPSGLTIHRMRLRPIEHDALPSQLVYLLDSPRPTPRASGTLDRIVRVGVESRKIITVSGDPPDDQMDELEMWCVRAIMDDETLGGVTHQVEEAETARDFDHEGEVFFGRTAKVFEVDYQTLRNDPELKT